MNIKPIIHQAPVAPAREVDAGRDKPQFPDVLSQADLQRDRRPASNTAAANNTPAGKRGENVKNSEKPSEKSKTAATSSDGKSTEEISDVPALKSKSASGDQVITNAADAVEDAAAMPETQGEAVELMVDASTDAVIPALTPEQLQLMLDAVTTAQPQDAAVVQSVVTASVSHASTAQPSGLPQADTTSTPGASGSQAQLFTSPQTQTDTSTSDEQTSQQQAQFVPETAQETTQAQHAPSAFQTVSADSQKEIAPGATAATQSPSALSGAAAPQQASAPQAAGNAQPAAAPATLDFQQPQMDANVARVMRGLHGAVNQNGGTITMRLTPPEMGIVRIQMAVSDGVVRADLQAQNESVRTLLNHQLSQLRHSLESQGLVVERLQVQAPPQGGNANGGGLNQQSDGSANDGRSRGEHAGTSNSQQRGEPQQQRQTFKQELLNTVG